MYNIPTITFEGGATPNPEHLKLHKSLTSPDSQDWCVLPNKEKILIAAFREQRLGARTLTFLKLGWAKRPQFLKSLRDLPTGHDLGVLSVYVATDAEEEGANSLLLEVAKISKLRSFNVMSMIMPKTDTRTAVRCMSPPQGAPAFDQASAMWVN
jgi:hypothetical protein